MNCFCLREFFVCGALILGPLLLHGQQMITDRPDQTESANVVPLQSLQIETGFLSETNDYYLQRLLPTTLIRYGITKKLELRVNHNFSSTIHSDTSVQDYVLHDVEIGFKYQLLGFDESKTQMAIIGHFPLPFQKRMTETVNFGILKFCVAHNLSETLTLSYNAGVCFTENGIGQFDYTLSVGKALTEKWAFYTELYGNSEKNTAAIINFDGGLTYLFKPRCQLDVSVAHGLNSKMYYFSTGLSLRIDKNK